MRNRDDLRVREQPRHGRVGQRLAAARRRTQAGAASPSPAYRHDEIRPRDVGAFPERLCDSALERTGIDDDSTHPMVPGHPQGHPNQDLGRLRLWPSAIRHSRSVRGSTTSHHAIGAGRWEARGWRWAYFSQPIFGGDRSLCSPVPSPPGLRQWAQSANSLGNWRARQDSNLRPSA